MTSDNENNVVIDVRFRVTAQDFVQMGPEKAKCIGQLVATTASLCCCAETIDATIGSYIQLLNDFRQMLGIIHRIEGKLTVEEVREIHEIAEGHKT